MRINFLYCDRAVVGLAKDLTEGCFSQRIEALRRAERTLAKREKITPLNGAFCLLWRAYKTVKNYRSQIVFCEAIHHMLEYANAVDDDRLLVTLGQLELFAK